MNDGEAAAAWDAWEDAYYSGEAEQERIDLVRIRAYALVLCDRAVAARKELDKALTAAERARKKAERAHARCNHVCELAEQAARFAARAMVGDVDADVRAEVATALEEVFG